MLPTLALAVLAFAPVLAPVLAMDQWPQFRGPGSAGVADDPALPESWSATENVAWKVDIEGTGWSSPIVWGDRIFLTSVIATVPEEKPKKGFYLPPSYKTPTDEHRWMVHAFDFKTGRKLWASEAHKGAPANPHHPKNTYASATPVTDGEHVYAYFIDVGLFCYDMSGKLVWSRPVEPAETRNNWGSGASPMLHENRVYLVNDNEQRSYLEAIDKRTGKTVWKIDRDEKTNYSTPYAWQHDGKTEIITTGTNKVRSYDPDGKVIWEIAGMSSLTIPVPFSSSGLLFVSSGYVQDPKRPLYVVKPGAHGDLTPAAGQAANEGLAWYMPTGAPYVPSPLAYRDIYYTLYDQGFLTAHDARTGKEIYGKQRIDPMAGTFTASLVAANGRIFATNEDGTTYVIQAGPEFKVLRQNPLDEFTAATPAIAQGSFIIRTATKLYRISKQ